MPQVSFRLSHAPPVSPGLHAAKSSPMTRAVPRPARGTRRGWSSLGLQRVLPLFERVLESIIGVLLQLCITRLHTSALLLQSKFGVSLFLR
eukprot:756106-Hanusia_phi.AAC.2